jgi:Radical SAM N-terminal
MTALPATAAPDLFGYRKYWAERLTPAPFLPMSREEMDALGWDRCDVILVTGDAYVDHPSFGMGVAARTAPDRTATGSSGCCVRRRDSLLTPGQLPVAPISGRRD